MRRAIELGAVALFGAAAAWSYTKVAVPASPSSDSGKETAAQRRLTDRLAKLEFRQSALELSGHRNGVASVTNAGAPEPDPEPETSPQAADDPESAERFRESVEERNREQQRRLEETVAAGVAHDAWAREAESRLDQALAAVSGIQVTESKCTSNGCRVALDFEQERALDTVMLEAAPRGLDVSFILTGDRSAVLHMVKPDVSPMRIKIARNEEATE